MNTLVLRWVAEHLAEHCDETTSLGKIFLTSPVLGRELIKKTKWFKHIKKLAPKPCVVTANPLCLFQPFYDHNTFDVYVERKFVDKLMEHGLRKWPTQAIFFDTPVKVKIFTSDNPVINNIWLSGKHIEYLQSRACYLRSVYIKFLTYDMTTIAPSIEIKSFSYTIITDTMTQLVVSKPKAEDLDKNQDEIRKYVNRHGLLGSIVIPYRRDSAFREDNLGCFLDYIQRHYKTLFEVVIVEMAEEPSYKPPKHIKELPVQYQPVKAKASFNRGWCMNSAIKKLIRSNVAITGDTDILPGGNFLEAVLACHREYDVINPHYRCVYTDYQTREQVLLNDDWSMCEPSEENVKIPTTFAGGMCIFRRDVFLTTLGGFEQYSAYGCEDRAMDVTINALIPKERIKTYNHAYIHLWHPTDCRANRDKAREHCVYWYSCGLQTHKEFEKDLHFYCKHTEPGEVRAMAEFRRNHIGDKFYLKNINTIPDYQHTPQYWYNLYKGKDVVS